MKVFIGPYVEKEDDIREISVEIYNYDLWNVDITLAIIIHPILIKYKNGLNSYPSDLETIDEWKLILDKMIYSFGQLIVEENDEPKDYKVDGWKDRQKVYWEKVQEGFNLFGKYYMNLWD